MLPIGLYATEVAVEGAATEPDVPVDEDVRRDVVAFAFEPEACGP